MTPASTEIPAGGDSDSGGWLRTVTQLTGLLAGLAGVVYVTGSVVLSIRLAAERLPWSNVVPQLPQQFVLSIGMVQVLLPALLLGALYGVYRLLRGNSRAPSLVRLRDFRKDPAGLAMGYTWTWLALLVPLIVVLLIRQAHHGPQPERVLVGWGTLLPAAIVVHELRAIATLWFRQNWSWNEMRSVAAMAGIYTAAAIPAMVLAAAALPLSDAKICTTDDFEETGAFVGESTQFVYLGERRPDDRRLAIIPLAKVEEMFIGPRAEHAACEPLEQPSSPGRRQK